MKLRLENGCRVNYKQYVCLILYCMVYAYTIDVCLYPYLTNGLELIMPYNKFFSLPLFFICIFSIVILYRITEMATSGVDSISAYAMKILFLLYQIPVSMTLCIFACDEIFKFWVLELIYWINICMIMRFCTRNRFLLPYKLLFPYKLSGMPIKYVRLIFFIIVVIGLIISVKTLGKFEFTISLSDVYGFRRFYKENSNEYITFFKTAMGVYLGPCLITYYVYKRKLFLSALYIMLQIAVFSLAKDKTYLFLIPISMMLGKFGDKVVVKFDSYMSYAYITISGFSLLATINQYLQLAIFELIIRRAFVIPSFFNYLYFYFFDLNEPIWWRQDTFLIDKLFTPVYDFSVPLVVANAMMYGKEGNPNAGMFAEAYSRCGLLGVVIYPILIVFLFKMIDRYFKNLPSINKIILGGSFAVALSNDVITSTGFVCTLILVVFGSFYFRERKSQEVKIMENEKRLE